MQKICLCKTPSRCWSENGRDSASKLFIIFVKHMSYWDGMSFNWLMFGWSRHILCYEKILVMTICIKGRIYTKWLFNTPIMHFILPLLHNKAVENHEVSTAAIALFSIHRGSQLLCNFTGLLWNGVLKLRWGWHITAAFGLLPSTCIRKRIQLWTKSLHPWHNLSIVVACCFWFRNSS